MPHVYLLTQDLSYMYIIVNQGNAHQQTIRIKLSQLKFASLSESMLTQLFSY